jgi:hypothetical protein
MMSRTFAKFASPSIPSSTLRGIVSGPGAPGTSKKATVKIARNARMMPPVSSTDSYGAPYVSWVSSNEGGKVSAPRERELHTRPREDRRVRRRRHRHQRARDDDVKADRSEVGPRRSPAPSDRERHADVVSGVVTVDRRTSPVVVNPGRPPPCSRLVAWFEEAHTPPVAPVPDHRAGVPHGVDHAVVPSECVRPVVEVGVVQQVTVGVLVGDGGR